MGSAPYYKTALIVASEAVLTSVAPPLATGKKIEYNLEGLRGCAALLVVWCHAVENERLLDPGYTVQGFWSFLAPSHLAVLLFFVLSGYVIGLATKQRLTGAAIGVYLKKRILRIYPIYFISLLLAIAVAQPYPLKTILGNFALLQVIITDIIRENDPSWSLHYEMLYYLLFIPVSYFRIPAFPAALICILIGALNLWLAPQHPLLTSYTYGFSFWLFGLGLSQFAKSQPRQVASFQLLAGMMLVLASLNYYNVFDTLAHKMLSLAPLQWLNYNPAVGSIYAKQIRTTDFAFLPYAAVFVLVFANKSFPGRKPLLWLLLGIPMLTFVYLFLHRNDSNLAPQFLATILYVVGMLCIVLPVRWLENASRKAVEYLIWVGGISYGLYIIHAPLLYGFKQVHVLSGSGATYSLRFGLFLVMALAASYWLEKKFQPLVRKFID